MVMADSETSKRAAIIEVAFTKRLDAAIGEAMKNPALFYGAREAGVDDQWLKERVRSARPGLADATRRDLDRYVDQHLAYATRYAEDPHAPQTEDENRPPRQLQDQQIVKQRLDVWSRRLALAVDVEIREAIGDWLRDQPGNLDLELGLTGRHSFSASTGIAYTADARRFHNVCADNPTGAIGLAGPRGCGKTTLLSHDLGNLESEPQNPAGRKVRVMVSAPVKYESRDFLLHLFAEICRSVIRQRHPAYWENFTSLRRRRFPIKTVTRSALTAILAYLAAIFVGQGQLDRWNAPLEDAVSYSKTVWAWMTLAFGEGTFPYAEIDALTTALLVVSAGATYVAVRRTATWLMVTRRDSDVPPLVRSARRHLETIRTLQTADTTGVTSEIGVGGIKLSANRSVERSVRAWSYPELINEMKEFLGQVTGADAGERGRNSIADYDPFGVVVAIDELDKIDSVDEVQRFINEIKGFFDAPGTQVLVSISEDALAAFELRGLPVRDAFDSAFVHVVRVGYLSISDTRRILERLHSPTLSRPFVWLVYCLSGGLPRDVIRVSGELHALARARPGEHLSAVCHELVEQDIQRRLPAFEQACGDLLRSAEAGSEKPILELVREIRRVAAANDQHQSANLIAVVPRFLAASGVEDLGKQTGCYLYYCATVLEILVVDELDATDEERFKRLLPVLVEGRQAMAVHPDLSVELIDEFRGKWGLPVLAHEAG